MKQVLGAVLALAVFAAPALAQTRSTATKQFPTSPWVGFAPDIIQCGLLRGANFNSTADQVIPIAVPSATYEVDSIIIDNASTSLTTAAGGFYPAASKGGTAIVANTQAYTTLTGAAVGAAGSTMKATLNNATAVFNLPRIYLSLTTAQGAAATADVRVTCRPHYG